MLQDVDIIDIKLKNFIKVEARMLTEKGGEIKIML